MFFSYCHNRVEFAVGVRRYSRIQIICIKFVVKHGNAFIPVFHHGQPKVIILQPFQRLVESREFFSSNQLHGRDIVILFKPLDTERKRLYHIIALERVCGGIHDDSVITAVRKCGIRAFIQGIK